MTAKMIYDSERAKNAKAKKQQQKHTQEAGKKINYITL